MSAKIGKRLGIPFDERRLCAGLDEASDPHLGPEGPAPSPTPPDRPSIPGSGQCAGPPRFVRISIGQGLCARYAAFAAPRSLRSMLANRQLQIAPTSEFVASISCSAARSDAYLGPVRASIDLRLQCLDREVAGAPILVSVVADSDYQTPSKPIDEAEIAVAVDRALMKLDEQLTASLR